MDCLPRARHRRSRDHDRGRHRLRAHARYPGRKDDRPRCAAVCFFRLRSCACYAAVRSSSRGPDRASIAGGRRVEWPAGGIAGARALRGRRAQFGLARIDWKIGAICLQNALTERRGGLQRLVCRLVWRGRPRHRGAPRRAVFALAHRAGEDLTSVQRSLR